MSHQMLYEWRKSLPGVTSFAWQLADVLKLLLSEAAQEKLAWVNGCLSVSGLVNKGPKCWLKDGIEL